MIRVLKISDLNTIMDPKNRKRYDSGPITRIDPGVISVFITDDLNQSLNELCIRMAVLLGHPFDNMMDYLSSHQLKYCINDGKYYTWHDWTPGTEDGVNYKEYLKRIEFQ